MVRMLVLFSLLGLTGDAVAASLAGRLYASSDYLGLSIEDPDTGPGPTLSDSLIGPHATAYYHASYGRLRGQASMSISASSSLPPFSVAEGSAAGEARFEDVMTINAPGLAGTTGTLRVRLNILGVVTSGANGTDNGFPSTGTANWLVNLQLGQGPGSLQQRNGSCTAYDGDGSCTYQNDPFGNWTTEAFSFTYGQPVQLQLALFATAGGVSVPGGSFSADSNLSSTVEWLGLEQVLDANGIAVATYNVTSESGTNWALPVPEPSIALLLALGLPVAFGLRATRGSNR